MFLNGSHYSFHYKILLLLFVVVVVFIFVLFLCFVWFLVFLLNLVLFGGEVARAEGGFEGTGS